jgi:hypothetical protein
MQREALLEFARLCVSERLILVVDETHKDSIWSLEARQGFCPVSVRHVAAKAQRADSLVPRAHSAPSPAWTRRIGPSCVSRCCTRHTATSSA